MSAQQGRDRIVGRSAAPVSDGPSALVTEPATTAQLAEAGVEVIPA